MMQRILPLCRLPYENFFTNSSALGYFPHLERFFHGCPYLG
jgi:hypothetical protein